MSPFYLLKDWLLRLVWPGYRSGVVELSDELGVRLQSAGADVLPLFGAGMGSWEVWLRRGGHHGRRATLVDLYELAAGSLGVRPEELPEADRVRLSMMTRPLWRAGLAVVPGSDRRGDPPGQCPALATASMTAR